MTFDESMEYIRSFSKSGAPVKDLSRMEALLAELGNPEKGQRYVHIAGTNGKGSTLAFSSAAAIEAGFRTGQFTSPFMLRYNDRIRINGDDIPDEKLAELCTRVSECNVASECSQFEITFAIALLWFKEENCDLVFLETGIGGLLDATNVIEAPLVSVITSVSPDHTALLGKSVPEIAAHKAGIIKQGCPVILSADNIESVVELVEETARKKSAILRIPDFCDCTVKTSSLTGTCFQYHSMEYNLRMPGLHQVYNAITAIEIVRTLSMHGYLISAQNVADAFEKVSVPARVQQIGSEPDIIVDGSHNQASILALADVIRSAGKYPVILVCGMLRSKDYETACHILAQVADYVICVDGFADDAVPADELARLFCEYCPVHVESYSNALETAKDYAGNVNGLIVITGSLYLASHYLGTNDNSRMKNRI